MVAKDGVSVHEYDAYLRNQFLNGYVGSFHDQPLTLGVFLEEHRIIQIIVFHGTVKAGLLQRHVQLNGEQSIAVTIKIAILRLGEHIGSAGLDPAHFTSANGLIELGFGVKELLDSAQSRLADHIFCIGFGGGKCQKLFLFRRLHGSTGGRIDTGFFVKLQFGCAAVGVF